MRPYWKGHLKLALVSCPIALHTACSSAERIRPLFAAPQRVINLMEALRQSIAQDQKPAGKSARRPRRPAGGREVS